MKDIKQIKAVIITSGQPCGNPRMVKEAIALLDAGYSVTVIYCPMSPWGDSFDDQLFEIHPEITWKCVGAHPSKQKNKFLWTRIRKKCWQFYLHFLGNHFHSALRSSALYSQELEREAFKHKADLYIGHNLGAIKAIVKAAKKYNSLASFDFEDFHRGEDMYKSSHWNCTKKIEDEFLPMLNLSTAASPLICKQYSEIYPFLKPLCINNLFPIKSTLGINSSTKKLKLIWFSQMIGENRGLETLIKAIGILRNPMIELTLLGNVNLNYKSYLEELVNTYNLKKEQLNFLSPVSPDEISNICTSFHIGLCTEEALTINRDICLTNKIFTYLMSRNALILSDTQAQNQFLNQYQNIGLIYKSKDYEGLSKIILRYYENRDLLEFHRGEAYRLAINELNWEVESKKLIQLYKVALT